MSNPLLHARTRIAILLQLPATLAILIWIPGNFVKLLAFLLLWSITFRKLSRPEALFALIVCVFFTGMNAASLKQGIFTFSHPDILGMPVYELVMWGFYLLHTRRLLGGPSPQGRLTTATVLALLYSVAFATIPDADVLLIATTILLVAGLAKFHDVHDFAYVGYMILLGAAVEYTGVNSGQWHYPGNPPGGVPIWFVTLWGGVGLFLRRIAVPILARAEMRRGIINSPH